MRVATLVAGVFLFGSLPLPLNPVSPASQPQSFPPGSGSIRGVVRLKSKIRPRSLAFNLYSRRRAGSASRAKKQVNELINVVVYLDSITTAPESLRRLPFSRHHLTSPTGEAVMRQVGETFIPHVLPVLKGTSVQFPNEDPFFHNVFSLSTARTFDLGRYPKKQVRSVTFSRPGVVKVFCHIHSHMNAVVLIFDHPFFSSVDPEGRFALQGIPQGEYALVTWHERMRPRKSKVKVQPGRQVTIELAL